MSFFEKEAFSAGTFEVPAFARCRIISNLSIIRSFKRIVCFLRYSYVLLTIQVVRLTLSHEETFACVCNEIDQTE